MLSNAYFLAKFSFSALDFRTKFCFDTAETEPAKNLQNFANFPNFANPDPWRNGKIKRWLEVDLLDILQKRPVPKFRAERSADSKRPSEPVGGQPARAVRSPM